MIASYAALCLPTALAGLSYTCCTHLQPHICMYVCAKLTCYLQLLRSCHCCLQYQWHAAKW